MHDGGVDVLNGVSGMEHLSNSLVRKPLQNFAAYSPMAAKIGVNGNSGFKRNDAIRDSINSREHSRGSAARN